MARLDSSSPCSTIIMWPGLATGARYKVPLGLPGLVRIIMCTLSLLFLACYCWFRHQWHGVSLSVPAYTPSVLGCRLIDSTCLSINTFYLSHRLLLDNLMDNVQAYTSSLPSFIAGSRNLFCILHNNQGLFYQTVNTFR